MDVNIHEQKGGKIGEYRVKIGRVRCGLGFYCYTHSLTHSLTQKDSIVAYAFLGSKLQKTELCFTYESRDTLKPFILSISVKTIAKLNQEHS